MREAMAWTETREVDRTEVWSTSDFPYQCLVDAPRTTAFRAAIEAVVRPGHVVVDGPISAPQRVAEVDLQRPATSAVEATLTVETAGGRVNAVRVCGRAHLAEGIVLGATGALNGGKVLPIVETRVTPGQVIQARITSRMGGGLGSFRVRLPL